MERTHRIMFVCHGNICRSPMAEFLLKDMIKKEGLADRFVIASAGTSREEIGNPVHNLKVRELYLKIIQGREVKSDDEDNVVQTIVDVDKVSITMGDFDWQKEQKATFTIKNIGDKPLAIEGVDTSCGCISVEYSKEPVRPGMDLKIFVI